MPGEGSGHTARRGLQGTPADRRGRIRGVHSVGVLRAPRAARSVGEQLMQILALLKLGAASRQGKPRSLWTAAEWVRVRAPLRHRDAELSPKAKRWFSRLPKD